MRSDSFSYQIHFWQSHHWMLHPLLLHLLLPHPLMPHPLTPHPQVTHMLHPKMKRLTHTLTVPGMSVYDPIPVLPFLIPVLQTTTSLPAPMSLSPIPVPTAQVKKQIVPSHPVPLISIPILTGCILRIMIQIMLTQHMGDQNNMTVRTTTNQF